MSFLQDDTISLEEARQASDAAAATTVQQAVYLATAENEKRATWDSFINYAVLSYAMLHGQVILRGTTFFSVFATFIGMFYLTVHFKSTVAAIIATPGAENRGRALMELVGRLLSLMLSYVQLLLVTISISRATMAINDGPFSVENFVLPVVVFVLFYVFYKMQSVRHTVPTATAS